MSSKVPSTTTLTHSHGFHRRPRLIRNYSLIWLELYSKKTENCYQNIVANLRSILRDVYTFKDIDKCIDFITKFNGRKVFLIMAGKVDQRTVSLIHNIPQLDSIYIFCDNQAQQEKWNDKLTKVKGIYTEMNTIYKLLRSIVNQRNRDNISISCSTMNDDDSRQDLNELEPSFMYAQILKEILFEINFNEKDIKNFVQFWRNEYQDDIVTLNHIDEFERNYHAQLSIWWYTRECFIYQLLNWSLRMLDVEAILKMGFFIRDLHCQIKELHKQQIESSLKTPFQVYRGQGLSSTTFNKIQRSKGGLMSFNNFLSTSEKQDVSLAFAESASIGTDMIGVLFIISIDPSIGSAPFAFISNHSALPQEYEILFSMNTIFRLGEVKQRVPNNAVWEVCLVLTNENDSQLLSLTRRLQEETTAPSGWLRMGKLMLTLGHFNQAEQLFKKLLENANSDNDKAYIFNQFASVKRGQGLYKEAASFYEKAIEIDRKTIPQDDPHFATYYSNIGRVYSETADYSKALEHHDTALKIQEKTLSPDHPDRAVSYSNVGIAYNHIGDYSKALKFYQRALSVMEKSLPSNHPDFADCYSNIGHVYNNLDEYSTALKFYEKALSVRQKSLTQNHPALAASYSDVGSVYNSIGDYKKALSLYQRVLEISENSLSSNHPDLVRFYNNIGQVYSNISDYSKALEYYEKALKISKYQRIASLQITLIWLFLTITLVNFTVVWVTI